MTNEQLIRQYYDGDDASLEKLYHKNIGLIRGIAKEAAAEFNCLIMEQHHPNQCSAYTKTILDDLCGEGALEFLTRIQSREYDESRAVLTTYLYPHLKGRMTRWLEQNLGCMALSKDEMAAVRQAQRLYHVAWKDTGEIAEELGIPEARVSRYVRYNTHFLGVHDLVPEGYEGDPYERLMPGMLSVSAERAVYRKVCIELLRELFDTLPKKRKPILKIQYIVAIKQYNAVFIAVTLCKYYAILYYTIPVTNKLLSFFQLTHDAIIHALIDNLKAVHKLIHDSPSLIIVCGGNGS